VWDHVKELKCDEKIWWGTDPKEAVQGANVVVTDTWYAPLILFIVGNLISTYHQGFNGTRSRV